jgi:hypothetical protein
MASGMISSCRCGPVIVGLALLHSVTASAAPIAEGLILRHDYMLGSGRDLSGNARHAVTGPGAVQMPRFVDAGGERGSRVTFPDAGADGKTLEQMVAKRGGDATIEIWFEGREMEWGPYLLFDSRSRREGIEEPVRGMTLRLEFPEKRADGSMVMRHASGEDHDVVAGATATGVLASTDVPSKLNVNRLHQYVYVFRGTRPDRGGSIALHVDGAAEPLLRGFYKTQLGFNVFSLRRSGASFTVAGKQDDALNQKALRGRLYRLLIYDSALTPQQITANHMDGRAAIARPSPGASAVVHAQIRRVRRDGEGLILVDDGKPAAVIVVGDEHGQDVVEAAQGLQSTILTMSGARLPVQNESAFVGLGKAAAILLGPSRLAARVGAEIRQDRDDGDRYVMRTGSDFVALVGNGHGELRGTSYAAYDLLQRLGCGWFGPNPIWHVIPRRQTIVVPPLDIDERPVFQSRAMSMAGRHLALRHAWRLGGRSVPVGDVMNDLVLAGMEREAYKKLHPGHFIGKARQPCYSHPQIIELVAGKLRTQIEAGGPGAVVRPITQNDNDAFCPCDRCRMVGNHGAQMLSFANRVAMELDRTHAGRFELTFLAYWSTHAPPDPPVEPHPAVSVLMVNEGDHMHPWEHAESEELVRRTGRNNTRELRDFAGWTAGGALKGIYEWWIPACDADYWGTVPWYSGDTHLKNLRHWKNAGLRYVYYETAFERGTGFPLRWPLYYVGARGLWDPDLTSQRIMTEACGKLFGRAAPHMLRFYELVERTMTESELTGGNWNFPSPERIYLPPMEDRATHHLEDAVRATEDASVRARIDDETKMWQEARRTLARLRGSSEQ